MAVGQIFFYKGKRYSGVQHNITFKWGVFLELAVLCCGLLYRAKWNNAVIWAAPLTFSLLCICPLLWKTAYFYKVKFLQKGNVLNRIYQVVIESVRLCGRVFWLLVDRLFLDKVVLGAAIGVSGVCLRIFRKIHTKPLLGALMIVVFMISLLWFS